MDLVTGALRPVLGKLVKLLADEYNLQKEAKRGIEELQTELEAIRAALEDISQIPVDKVKEGDKIWARNMRELSYDIEDSIDRFMIHCKDDTQARRHGWKKVIRGTLDRLKKPMYQRQFGTEIRDLRSRAKNVSEVHDRYKIDSGVSKPVTIDPRVMAYNRKDLVNIDEARDKLIQCLMGGNEVSQHQDKIVSIVGFGGLGKTTLANEVYEKLRPQFDCSAFISVSQTPDMDKLFNDMMYQLLKKHNNVSIDVASRELNELLKDKRYFVVIDDIWDIQNWKKIKCALPDNGIGCKIITTTRISNIAAQVGGAYNMIPLSLDDSRILLYKRIFVKEDEEKCLDGELTKVCDRILEKCAGVPLAIVTIASLLANNEKNKWYEVCDSIGTGLEKNFDVENMKNILLLSYYHLPSHLRTCLLYLSMFPEDYKVDKDCLIWMWIAEGFIQGQRLYEVGESYLNKLINRSMIQCSDWECYVHDMVLEVIRSLSREENFVAVNDVDHKSPSKKFRGLSLQNDKITHLKPEATAMSMQQVRSVVVFSSAVEVMPSLENFRVLRVLNLVGCDLSHGYSLKHLGKLRHLRYLGLQSTNITQLPAEVGNLQLLQTLDIRADLIASLPLTISQLINIMRLVVRWHTRVPNGIRSLKSLEVLYVLTIEDSNVDIVRELGYLTELRELYVCYITEFNKTLGQHLVESLQKLQKIQELSIQVTSISYIFGEYSLDGWVVGPLQLRTLQVRGVWFSTLPAWIDPLKMADLSRIIIYVRTIQPEALEILGRLPKLCHLDLTVDQIIGGFVVGAGLFPCLSECNVFGDAGPVVFCEAAMPLLERLTIPLWVRVAGENSDMNDLGLEKLPSLKSITVYLESGGASEEVVQDAEAALKHVAEIHPNHPQLETYDWQSGIRYLQTELDDLKDVLQRLSEIPVDELEEEDKIWARSARELSSYTEDIIDKLTTRYGASETPEWRCFNKYVATLGNLLALGHYCLGSCLLRFEKKIHNAHMRKILALAFSSGNGEDTSRDQ